MRALAILLAGSLASACTDGGTIHYADYGRYSGSTAYYAARTGYMPLMVYGNPTHASQNAFTGAMARALKGTHLVPGVEFTPADPAVMRGYRTVLAFGSSTEAAICSSAPITAATPKGASGPLNAAFCLDAEPLSFLSGAIPAANGPEDPVLRQQMAAIGHALFPPNNPNRSQDCWPGALKCL